MSYNQTDALGPCSLSLSLSLPPFLILCFSHLCLKGQVSHATPAISLDPQLAGGLRAGWGGLLMHTFYLKTCWTSAVLNFYLYLKCPWDAFQHGFKQKIFTTNFFYNGRANYIYNGYINIHIYIYIYFLNKIYTLYVLWMRQDLRLWVFLWVRPASNSHGRNFAQPAGFAGAPR